jgi:hypothetical protein
LRLAPPALFRRARIMIISYEHKLIFLKTKKTAGTAIEAALSELCGPHDVITPFREDSESERKGRGPQNYRIEHPLKPRRPLWRRLLLRPERYYHPTVGFYEHMPASVLRAYVGEEIWRSYFKFAFEQSLGPAGLLVPLQDQVEAVAAQFRALHGGLARSLREQLFNLYARHDRRRRFPRPL